MAEEKHQFETVMEPADVEDKPSLASEFSGPLSSPARSPAWTETETSQDINVEDEDPVEMPLFSDVIDEMEEDHESLVTMDDNTCLIPTLLLKLLAVRSAFVDASRGS